MNAQTNGQKNGPTRTENWTNQPGKILGTMDRARKPEARPLITPQDQPRVVQMTIIV